MILENGYLSFTFHPDYLKEVEAFINVYELVNHDFITNEEIKGLKDSKFRKCRYCNKSYPDVKFDNRAHTMPEFLGNNFSLSDFECDTCNKLFGKYEKQLSNYLGISMSVNRTKGKKKIPSFQSYDKQIEAKKIKFYDATNAIRVESLENKVGVFLPDNSNFGFSATFSTQPYVPIEVYKAFLKMALGLIPENEITINKLGFDFLLKKEVAKKFIGFSLLSLHTIDFNKNFNVNGIVLFKRRSNIQSLAPLYTMILFYGQHMYQIFIPFQNDYLSQISGKTLSCPLIPPILPDDSIEQLVLNSNSEQLDSHKKITRQQTLFISGKDPNEKVVAINSDGTVDDNAKYDPNIITKIVIIDDPNFYIPIKKNNKE